MIRMSVGVWECLDPIASPVFGALPSLPDDIRRQPDGSWHSLYRPSGCFQRGNRPRGSPGVYHDRPSCFVRSMTFRFENDSLPRSPSCRRQMNVVQSLLRAVLALRPLPTLPVDLLGALAVTFNAWHTVIPLFEHQVGWGVVAGVLPLPGACRMKAALPRRRCVARGGDAGDSDEVEVYNDL